MNQLKNKVKTGLTISAGMIWGILSTFWCGFHILIAGNLMEESGSYDYEEAESFRPYGVIGLIIYVICFGTLLLCLKKGKVRLPAFLIPMLFGILSVCAYYYLGN